MEDKGMSGIRKAIVLSVTMVLIAFLYFFNSSAVIAGVKDGLAACVNAVIPSLFPFMVLCSFLINSRLSNTLSRPLWFFTAKVFHLPKHAGTVVLLSMIGGYPVGARAIAQLCREKRLDAPTAARMLCFCVNAGPAFLITAVGTKMFANQNAGIFIFTAQTLASILIGCFLGLRHKEKPHDYSPAEKMDKTAPLAQSFVDAVTGAAQGILNICAFVVVFSAILALAKSIPLTANIYAALPYSVRDSGLAAFTGLFEVTLGCASAAAVSGEASIILACALCSFGGLSVICQTISCFRGSKVSMRPYLLSRAVHMLLSCLTVLGLKALFPDAVATFSFTQSPISVHSFSGTPLAACALLLLCAALIMFKKDKLFL